MRGAPVLSSKKKKKKRVGDRRTPGMWNWSNSGVEGIGLVSHKDQLDHPGQKAPLDYLCVQEHTLASGNLNRDSPSSVHLARVSLIGINLICTQSS